MKKLILPILMLGLSLASCHKKDCEIAKDIANKKYSYMKKAQEDYAQNPSSSNHASMKLRVQDYEQALKTKEKKCSK